VQPPAVGVNHPTAFSFSLMSGFALADEAAHDAGQLVEMANGRFGLKREDILPARPEAHKD